MLSRRKWSTARRFATAISQAAALCKRVEFSAEDATRTELEFLKEVFACAVENYGDNIQALGRKIRARLEGLHEYLDA